MIVGLHLIKNEQNDHRSDDRQYQAGRMKQSPVTRFGKQPGDQSSDN